jgi:hypothetical protein
MTGLAAAVLSGAVLLALGFLAGCTGVGNEQARGQIADANYALAHGNYNVAHQHFAAAATKVNTLSPRQRREVMDGLRRTEQQIGLPSFSLAQQLRTCSSALNEPESESGPIFSEVARKERAAVTETIEAALAELISRLSMMQFFAIAPCQAAILMQ